MAGDAHERRMVTLLLILSGTTGLVDAVSVLGLGKVFTANMTGNLVFLGFAMAGAPGFSWVNCVAALLAFMAGAVIAARICRAQSTRPKRRWLLAIACGEAALLWLAAAASLLVSPATAIAVPLMIVLTALAMGIRNATVRQLKVADLTTTVLTLTITGIAADSRWAGGAGTNLPRRALAVAAILIGALSGAILLRRYGLAIPLLLAGAIVLSATIAIVRDEPDA